MSDTLERDLRRSLADHAPDLVDHADPWDRVQRGVVVRRRRRAGALAGSLALAVALGGGLAVVRPWAGGEPVPPATVAKSGWGLDDGTPRGALGGDETLRAGVEEVFAASLAGPAGGGTDLVPGSTRLVFADDVAGTRLVVAVATGRGVGTVGGVLTGPEGSAAADLGAGATPPVPVVGTAPAVGQVVMAEDGPRLLAVVPRGARVSVSDAVRVEADGAALSRDWREIEVSSDGLVDTALSAEPTSGLAVLRVDSAPGYGTDPAQAVAELAFAWPGPFDAAPLVAAQEVVARGPVQYRDGGPRPVADDQAAQDVAVALEMLGRPAADDVRLLHASADGADVERGASGWSSLVEVRAGGGSVVVWQQHPPEGGAVRTAVVPAPADTTAERVLLRARLDQETELVGVWTGLGGLGAMTIDGEDAFLPLAFGFRWFAVPAGTEVVVDGEAVPPAPQETATGWPLPGEGHPGPQPLFGD